MPLRRSDAPDQSRWYPSANQLADPAASASALRVVLDQFYALQDRHEALQASHAELKSKVGASSGGPPAGSGPADSMILGLRVGPMDTNTLADGAALKYVKKNGAFEFS